MASARVVHYDIKADNILLQPHPDVGDDALTRPPTATPPFDLVLADFGESRRFHPDEEPITSRNRGTECIKSPEMLQVANATKKARANFDRRRKEGAGAASDVWSLGCLLYELVVGDFLYHDPDWIRFFFRVTRSNEDILPPDKATVRILLWGIDLIEMLSCHALGGVYTTDRVPGAAGAARGGCAAGVYPRARSAATAHGGRRHQAVRSSATSHVRTHAHRVEATQQQLSSVRYRPPAANPDATASGRSSGSVQCPTAPGTARLTYDATALEACLRRHVAATLVPVAWAADAVQTYLGGAAAATDARVLLRHGVTHALLLRAPAGDDTHDRAAAEQAVDACRRAFIDVRVVQVEGLLASDAPRQGLSAQQAAQHLDALHAADPAACTALLYDGLAAQAAAEMAVLLQAQAATGVGVLESLTALLRARPCTVLQVRRCR